MKISPSHKNSVSINIYLRNKSPQKAIDIIDAYKGSRYVNEAAYYKAYAFKMLGKGDEARVLAEQCFLDCKKVGNWAYADSSLMLLEGLYKAKGQVVNQLRVSEDRREVALLLAAWNLYNEKENLVANYEIDKAEQQYLPLLYPVAPEKKSNTIIITRTKVFVFMSILLLVALYVSRLYQKVKRLESK